VYAWGGHHDAALLGRLDLEPQLGDCLPKDPRPRWGYQKGRAEPSAKLRELRSLKTFEPWGPIKPEWFEPAPAGVGRQPDERLYEGPRLLFKSLVKAGFGPYVRFEETPLAFRHTIYCMPLHGVEPWKAKVMLGTLLSSLGRYRLFMLSAAWGVWHDQIYGEELQRVPVRLDRDSPATDRLIEAVDALQAASPRESDEPAGLWEQDAGKREPSPAEALERIDEAVYELFELSRAERDLVSDFWLREHARRHKPAEPAALPKRRFGRAADLPRRDSSPYMRYLDTFLAQWNRELAPHGGELSWQLEGDSRVPVVSAVFETLPRGTSPRERIESATEDWEHALRRLGPALLGTEDLRRRLYRDGIVRAVSDTAIVIVKRNEERLWTASAAREDAEATLLQAMALPQG